MLDIETPLRLGAFLGGLGLLLLLERLAPWRAAARPLHWRRWPGNLGLAVLGSALVKLVLPLAAVGAAVLAQARDWGLFPALALPGWLAVMLTLLMLDLLVYWQHRATHAIPLLWRLHRVHHADPELDATSALRFHPVEIVLSMLLKVAAVLALGAPPAAVLAFEVMLNAVAMFNHAAIALPGWLERPLRWLLVTPSLHRIHHSARPEETDSVFGFGLSWWDRLFGTWRAEPAPGLVIGLPGWRAEGQGLWALLAQPLRKAPR